MKYVIIKNTTFGHKYWFANSCPRCHPPPHQFGQLSSIQGRNFFSLPLDDFISNILKNRLNIYLPKLEPLKNKFYQNLFIYLFMMLKIWQVYCFNIKEIWIYANNKYSYYKLQIYIIYETQLIKVWNKTLYLKISIIKIKN